MITIDKKDFIVSYLVAENYSVFTLTIDEDFKKESITYDECDLVLRQLEDMGLLKIQTRFSNPRGFVLAVNAGLHDFNSRGAFKAQELILTAQLEKLDAEIQLLRLQMEPDKLEQLNKVVSLFASACNMTPYIQSAIAGTKSL